MHKNVMTNIFTFSDNVSIVAGDIKEAIETRKESLIVLETQEKKEVLKSIKNCLKGNFTQNNVQDFQELDAQYTVVNHDENITESRHQYMLETYGKDQEMARLTDPHHIWTILEGDNTLTYICPGFHYVNRIGYLQTQKPWKDPDQSFLW